jgi:hypothetical protein
LCGVSIELEDSEGAVAEVAEEAADPSREVVVVNCEVSLPRFLSADSTASALRSQELGVRAGGEPVSPLDVLVMVLLLLR